MIGYRSILPRPIARFSSTQSAQMINNVSLEIQKAKSLSASCTVLKSSQNHEANSDQATARFPCSCSNCNQNSAFRCVPGRSKLSQKSICTSTLRRTVTSIAESLPVRQRRRKRDRRSWGNSAEGQRQRLHGIHETILRGKKRNRCALCTTSFIKENGKRQRRGKVIVRYLSHIACLKRTIVSFSQSNPDICSARTWSVDNAP